MKFSLASTLALLHFSGAFVVGPKGILSHPKGIQSHVRSHDNGKMPSPLSSPTNLLVSPDPHNLPRRTAAEFDHMNMITQIGKGIASAMVALTISFNTFGPLHNVEPAFAADGKAIGLCLLNKCKLPLAKCITNPNCLANVICINTCNGKEDETGCQIKCGDIFENEVVGEFNKCAVSDMDCVPTRPDDGAYPVPADDIVVPKFNTNLWNGKWYITAGQNELFDIFPCQVHFFTETEPGKFFGKLNWVSS